MPDVPMLSGLKLEKLKGTLPPRCVADPLYRQALRT
jgi:hypothetical protein